MQLIERGVLAPDDAAGAHVPFAVTNPFGGEVTISQLFTHTARLGSSMAGSVAAASEFKPLAEVVPYYLDWTRTLSRSLVISGIFRCRRRLSGGRDISHRNKQTSPAGRFSMDLHLGAGRRPSFEGIERPGRGRVRWRLVPGMGRGRG